MVKITHKDVALLISKSESYTRQLLLKEGVSMKVLEEVIDFVINHRQK